MIECDAFDVEIKVIESPDRIIAWELFTDLPCGTKVIVSCNRVYKDYDDEECVWTLDDDTFIVEPTSHGDLNGAKNKFDVDKADKKALVKFNDSITQYSSGIKTTVSDEINLSFIVGGGQIIKAFGKYNGNLTGSMVFDSGGIQIIEVESKVILPMSPKYQPTVA
jgi:hypothetical protein